MKEPLSPTLRALLGVVLAAVFLPLLLLTQSDLERRKLAGRSAEGERYYLPPAKMLRTLCFGFNELAADLVWIRSIAYFTDHIASDRDLQHLDRYLRTIVALDPHVPAVYRYGSSMLSSLSGNNQAILQAIELLKQGHAAIPDNQDFPFKIGVLYMSELHTQSASQRRKWRIEGAKWLQRAILLGADEPWLPSLAAQILTKSGKRQMAIHHLQEVYLITQDPETRNQIAAKLAQMRAAGLVDQLRETQRRQDEAQRKSRIPFVSADLYALIAPPPSSSELP